MVIAQPVLIVTYLLSGDVFFLCSGMLPCFSLYLTSPSPVAHVTRLPLFAVTHKLDETVLYLLLWASDKDVKQDGSWNKPLLYLTCCRPLVYICVL